jgi:hypothetical protein
LGISVPDTIVGIGLTVVEGEEVTVTVRGGGVIVKVTGALVPVGDVPGAVAAAVAVTVTVAGPAAQDAASIANNTTNEIRTIPLMLMDFTGYSFSLFSN